MNTQLEKREPTDAELMALFAEEDAPTSEPTDEELAALFSGVESEESGEPTDAELMAMFEEPREDGEPTDSELMAMFKERPEMSALDQASAAASKFTEGSLGLGDELGAIGSMIGGGIFDLFNTDKSVSEIWDDNAQWDRQIDGIRAGMDKLEEANPVLSGAATVTGMVAGLGVPAATLGKLGTAGKIGMAAGEGALYGAASGRETEGRLIGAGIGAATGGAVGAGVIKGGKMLQERAARKAEEANINAELGESLGTPAASDDITIEQPRMSDEGFTDEYELPMGEAPTRREFNLNTGDDAVDEAASSILEEARVIRETARRGDVTEQGIPSDKTAKDDFQQPGNQSPKEDFIESADDLYLTAPQIQKLDEALGTNNSEYINSLQDALEDGQEGLTVRDLKDFMALRGTDDANELLGDVLLDGIAKDPDQISGFMRAFRSILRPKSRTLEKSVSRGFSSAVDRGLIRGMRANAKVDEVLGAGGVTGRLNSLFVDNNKFAAAVLNQSNTELPIAVRQANYDNARSIAKANGIDDFDNVMQKIAESTNIATQHAGKNFAKVFSTFDNASAAGKPQYMHVATAPERVIGKTPGVHVEEGVRAEGALKEATRGVVKADEVDKFASPFESHRQFLSNLNNQTELARALNLRVAGVGGDASDLNSVVSGKYMDKAIRERLQATNAYSPEKIDLAVDGVKDVTVRAEKSMAAELQALRDVTYYGLLAKPFSAVLNFSELGNSVVTQGFGNTVKAATSTTVDGLKNMPYSVGQWLGPRFGSKLREAFPEPAKIEAFDAEVQGLIQSVQNDVVKSLPTGSETIPGAAAASRATRKILNWGMKWSGTKTIDLGVKETTLRAAFNRGRAAMKAKSPKGRQAFIRENRRFFSDEELHLLMDSLKRVESASQVGKWANSSNPALQRRADLIMDYNMLQLKEMQPVAPSDLPEWALRHPAGRSLYTFLNFSIKQAEFIEKRTIDAVKQGRYADAAKFAASYILITGGLTSTIMEGRDSVFKGQPFDWITPTNSDGTESQSDTAGSVLTRMLPWGLSTFSSGILPHTPYGMDKFKNDPWGETLDDRLVGYKGVYDNLKDDAKGLVNKGRFPHRTARMATPWGRPAEALMEHVWETTGMGDLAKKEFGVNKKKYLDRIGQPVQED